MAKTPKAIALMSGGLDSTLAARLVKDQGVEVIGLHLSSPFGCPSDVQKSADIAGVPLMIREKGEAYLDLVKNPRFGYGRNINPCIDCRIFMFQLADVVRQEQGADFIVTGEVLGQRPMSQHRHAFKVIDSHSPLEGLILRPLSAHYLPPSVPEQKGWVDREKLHAIAGRGRKAQMALAEELGIKEYEAPGGGCLLTQATFATRLRDYFAHDDEVPSEVRLARSQLLAVGRHFRLNEQVRAIVGRHQQENEVLEKLWEQAGTTLFRPVNFVGPAAVATGVPGRADEELVGALLARYGKKDGSEAREIEVRTSGEARRFQVAEIPSEEKIQAMLL